MNELSVGVSNVCTADTTNVLQKEIERSINILLMNIESIALVVNDLEERLSPVMSSPRPHEPKAESGPTEEKTVEAPLAQKITGSADDISDVYGRCRHILERLEL